MKNEKTSKEIGSIAGRGMHACPAVQRSAELWACSRLSDGRLLFTPVKMTLGELRRVCASAETQVTDKKPAPRRRSSKR